MTLLNKPFKEKVTEVVNDLEGVENKSVQKESSVNDDKRNIKFFEISLWSLSILVLLSVIMTGVLLIYAFDVSQVVQPLKVESLSTSQYKSIPKAEEIFIFDEAIGSIEDSGSINASALFAYNPVTHQVYYSNSQDEQLSIASITKLMTMLVARKHFELDSEILVTEIDLSEVEWKLGLVEGDKISFEDAMHAMLLNSYNDVAYVVADNHPGGFDGFVSEMNQYASEIGMEDTNFTNPAGLDDPDHYSTGRDIKRLVQLVLKDEVILDTVTKEISIVIVQRIQLDGTFIPESITLQSTNEMLGEDPTVAGLKTGYTTSAGQSFVGYFMGEGNDQLITIVLNANGNRFDVTRELLNQIREVY